MAMLVNGKMLEAVQALRDATHPMHKYAVDYTQGLAELREKFGKRIRFIRPDWPKFNKGADSRGNEVLMKEPTPPAMFPLERSYAHPERGEEIWSCCLNMPQLLPNNLWSIGKKKSIKIEKDITVDIDRQPDLAYYLYYISRFGAGKDSRLKVDDPGAELRAKAEKERLVVARKTAIWQMLPDENILRRMAAAYGVANSAKKSGDQLRFDLEAQLEANDNKKNKDPFLKGTKEFLEEMKVTDAVRLRAFIQGLIDDNKLVYKPDGRYRLGEKAIVQVPQSEINKRVEWLYGYYNMPNNNDKLQELMRDVVDKEYLDSLVDDKDFAWLAKTMGINVAFKKKEDIKSMVYDAFSIAL